MGDNEAARGSRVPLNSSAAAPDPTRARLERIINDVIADHGLEGPAKQSAGDFTRKVGVQVNLLYMCDGYGWEEHHLAAGLHIRRFDSSGVDIYQRRLWTPLLFVYLSRRYTIFANLI